MFDIREYSLYGNLVSPNYSPVIFVFFVTSKEDTKGLHCKYPGELLVWSLPGDFSSLASLSNGRGSWVVGASGGSWVWVWVKVVGVGSD